MSTIKLKASEGSTIFAALSRYAEQREADTLTSTGDEAVWNQDEARIARKILVLMGQMNHAGERGRWELSWINEE